MIRHILLLLFLAVTSNLFSQKSLLKSGPMVGYAGYREALIWIQTTKKAEVKVEYWKKGNSTNTYFTDEVLSKKEDEFVVKLFPNQLNYCENY